MPLEDTLTILMRERTTPIVRFVNGPTQPSCTEMIVPVQLLHSEGPCRETKRYTRYYKFWFVGEILPPRDKDTHLYVYRNVVGTVYRDMPFSENVQMLFGFNGWTAKLTMNKEVSEEEYDTEIWKYATEGLRRKIKTQKEIEKIWANYIK